MKNLAIILTSLLVMLLTGCTKQAPEHPLVVPQGDFIKISVKDVYDGCVHFYTYRYHDKNINFFVRTDGRGKFHTHYDACYSCYKYKRGFRIAGSDLLCIACNLKYSLYETAWDFIGPCAPILLRSKVKNEFIVIKLSVIRRGEKLF